MQRNRRIGGWILGSFVMFSAAMTAQADTQPLVFNFNNLAVTTSNSSSQVNTTATNIQNYMDAVLAANGCTGCSVTVTGAAVDSTYDADGNTVGPTTTTKKGRQTTTTTTPVTLGNTDGATGNNATPNSTTDTYLGTSDNNGDQIDNPNSQSGAISIVFHGLTVTNATFDYEIFPDINCQSITTGHSPNCGTKVNGVYSNLPTFEFSTGALSNSGPNQNGNVIFTTDGVTPGNGDGNETNSPDNSPEYAPQYIGMWNGQAISATQLNFIDWPATVAIDNLSITYTTTTTTHDSSTPEPGTWLLFGTMLLAVVIVKAKSRKANANA